MKKAKRKVVFLTPSLKSGGLERIVVRLANYYKNRTLIVSLDSASPFYELDNEVRLLVPPRFLKKTNRVFTYLFLFFWVRRILYLERPDVICTFGERYNPFFILASFGLRIRIIAANRASPSSSLVGLRGFLNPLLYRFVNGVVLQTETARRLLETKYRMKSVAVIGNPINLSFPQVKRESVVLNVGSFTGKKNQLALIRIFDRIASAQDWHLEFVGDGEKRVVCEKYCDSLSCSGRVNFLGVRKDVEFFYAKASIFAFTSLSEGFPNALAEAMAAGCACIAYDCIAGPSDIIDDDINGYLVPEGNEELFIKRLELLMTDEELRMRFGKAAKEKMKQFDAEMISMRYMDFILP